MRWKEKIDERIWKQKLTQRGCEVLIEKTRKAPRQTWLAKLKPSQKCMQELLTRWGREALASSFTTTLNQLKPWGTQSGRKRDGKKWKGSKQKQNDKQSSETPKQVDSFVCGEVRHYANRCPTRLLEDSEGEDRKHSHVTWGVSIFMTTASYHAYACRGTGEELMTMDVLLDNQS